MTNILDKEEIALIKLSGRILKSAMNEVTAAVKQGISTQELDRIANSSITRQGGKPSFLNYEVEGSGKFPASLCVSINDEIVHGIPNANRIIKNGDIVSLDLGVKYTGMCTDMAVTIPVGEIPQEAKKIIEVAKQCLAVGINKAKSGNRIGDIGEMIQNNAESSGFSVVRELVGHGIGRKAHLEPQIPNFKTKVLGPVICEGMALAIEPMITAGSYKIKVRKDGWTVATADGSLAAHFEHTVVIENGLPVIVTSQETVD